ncbi:MAG: ABC transporter permease [Candidatus Izimaplasma sp.]|nr:ABC transporter permease [Candidatus Izimaplasma bacterium]
MKTNRFFYLIKGELIRLHKYKVTTVSLMIAIIWGVVLYFVEGDIFNSLLPFLILIDATMMSLMYIGSVMFFEKKESTISTMLVTPSKHSEIILSKIFANTIHNFFSTALIIIAFVLIKDIQINYFLIALAVIIATLFHTTIGLLLSYYQKDFTTMLTTIMSISFVLVIPSALYGFNILTADIWEYILLINPIQAAAEIINQSFKPIDLNWKYYFSIAYLVVGGILVYKYLVLSKFKKYAVSISGV